MNITLRENETMQDLVERLAGSFELVYDIAPVAYWYENLYENGRIRDIHFSKRMRDILGYRSVDEFPDELNTLMTFTHPEDVHLMLDDAILAGTGRIDKYDVQYRIRKADGSYMLCNATGELVKDHNGVTVGMYGAFIDISEEMELQKDQENRRRTEEIINGFTKEYEVAFVVDLNDGQYRVIREKAEMDALLPRTGTFFPALKRYAETMVHPSDRARVQELQLSEALFRESLAVGQSRSFEFRSSTSGIFMWYRGTFSRINEDTVLAGFRNCDEEHTLRLVNEKLIGEYDAIYVVSLLRGKIRAVRPSRVSQAGVFEGEQDYSAAILRFAETVASQYREDWVRFSSVEYMQWFVSNDDRREYVYELPEVGKSMRRFTVDVIERDKNGTAVSLLFSFMGIDDDRASAIRLYSQLAKQHAISDGLAREYHTVWLVEGFGAHNMHLYRSTGVKTIRSAVKLGLDMISYDAGIVAYIREHVHEDDRQRVLEETRFETVERKTPETGTYVVTYRRYNSDRSDFDYHQMCYARAVGDNGAVNYVFAYRDADKTIREQLEKQARFTESTQIINALTEDFTCVNYVELKGSEEEDTTVGYRTSELLIRLIPGWEKESRFSRKLDLIHDHLVYEPDKAQFYKDTRREKILAELENGNYCFVNVRLLTDGEPHYYQIQFNAIRTHGEITGIVAGLHSVDEQMKEELEAERLKTTEVQLQHEQLRSEVLNYMVDHGDKDPIELLKNFAERIRVLINCDQVIYRDLEETRIMVNSPAIEKTWSVPIEYCRQCEHFDAHHPMYAGGYTEMSNCQEGWQGIPVYGKCPIKSSLTRIVYCDGEIAGYLAIHYVQKYHEFTDVERVTLEEFTRILSMSLSRYAAKSRAAELDSIRHRMNMIYSLSDEFDPILVLDPESGVYDWYGSSANEIGKLTAMSVHGTDFYREIGQDAASVIHEDDRERFRTFYTKENMMKIASVGRMQETENRWRVGPDGTYLWKYNKVVRMVAEDGKVYIVVGVVDTTEEKKKQKEYLLQRKRAEEQAAFTTYFLEPYLSAYYVGFDSLSCQIYKRTDRLAQEYPIITNYVESVQEYIEREVHPDDRAEFLELVRPEKMKALLAQQPEFSYDFRTVTNGEEKTLRFQVIRGADVNHAAFGFKDITAEVRLRLEQEKKLKKAEDAEKLVESIAGIYRFAFAVDMAGTYFKIIRMDDEVKNTLHISDLGTYRDATAPLLAMLHPADRERMIRELSFDTVREKLKDAFSYNVVYRVINNGSTEWHEMNVTQLYGDEIAMGFGKRDLEITKRHLEERRFSEYFGLYEADLDTGMFKVIIDSPYYTFSETGEAVPYSDAMRRFAESQVGETKEFFLNLADPGWVRNTLRADNMHSFTYQSVTAGNSWVDVTSYVTMRHDDGTPAMFALGFSFVSSTGAARQEMQKRLNESSQMISGLASGYMAVYYVNINEGALTVYALNEEVFPETGRIVREGKDPFETLRAFGTSGLIHPDDRHLFADMSAETFRRRLTGQKRFSMRYRRAADSGYLWNEMDVIKYENADEQANAVIVGFTDCDEEIRRDLEQQKQLEEALAMAQSASRAKTTFLNNMSHDIRTPMNAIIGYTGLAASHIDNREQVQDYLSKISQSSDHLLSLINDVLDMSRIESGKMNLSEKEENLSDIIHTLRDIVQADIHSKQLDFFVDAVDVVDETIICDKLRLNQVLLNILSNSIKYTQAGGTVTMRVTEKTVKSSGYASYEFSIKDNGMGMDGEFLKTIFDPFTRVKSSTVSGIQGTGLGMAITKNIIDMMGGTIDIKSEPGKGTETVVRFDFKLRHAPKEPEEIPELKGVRALVADDDANTCLSVCKMVSDIGMRFEWCTSGREAVIRAEAAYQYGDAFRVYIIDWIMPDMNGIETARRIRKVIGDDTPIIILTAYDWSDIEEEAREAGVTAFVSKPMFPSDLHRVLNACIGREDTADAGKADEYSFNGKKILLVEDNEMNREIATEILEENGFTLDTAEDGDIAVEKMRHAGPGTYDLILMDVQMPRMDGYEATRQIRALGTGISKIPILAMTANAFEEDRKAALEAGMNEHIAKPINIAKLKAVLSRFL